MTLQEIVGWAFTIGSIAIILLCGIAGFSVSKDEEP